MSNYIQISDIDNWPVAVEDTEDFATTAVDIANNKITVVNDIPTATEIKFSSTGTLPSPLIIGTTYYAIRVDATHIKVASNPVNSAAGTAIDLTSVGSGTHTLDIGSGSSDAERQEVIDRAESKIEWVTKDYFYSKDYVWVGDGNDQNRLFLQLLPDIISISEIKWWDQVIPSDYYTHDKNSVYNDPSTIIGYLETDRPYHKRVLFPLGTKNIQITLKMGWATTPSAIKQAAVILVRAENDSTLYSRYSHNKSESVEGYSFQRPDKYMTGILEADDLVYPYIRRKISFGSV